MIEIRLVDGLLEVYSPDVIGRFFRAASVPRQPGWPRGGDPARDGRMARHRRGLFGAAGPGVAGGRNAHMSLPAGLHCELNSYARQPPLLLLARIDRPRTREAVRDSYRG